MNLFTYWLLFYKSREEKQTDKQEREEEKKGWKGKKKGGEEREDTVRDKEEKDTAGLSILSWKLVKREKKSPVKMDVKF